MHHTGTYLIHHIMKVRTKHPVTGKVKIVEMTEDEYGANKILDPIGTFRVPDTAIVDEEGCIRYTMSSERLNKLYKDFEDLLRIAPNRSSTTTKKPSSRFSRCFISTSTFRFNNLPRHEMWRDFYIFALHIEINC